MDKGYRYYRAGCYALIAIGFSHFIGHLLPIHADTDAEAQMLMLMTTYQKKVLGGKMSAMEVVDGFSLCYTLFFIYAGLINLFLLQTKQPIFLSKVSILNALIFLCGVVISLIYFFWLPVISFMIISALFTLAFLFFRKKTF